MGSRANERWLARTLPPWAMYWAADSAVLLTSQALTIGATSAAAVLIARHVNPHDWGIFSGFLSLSLGVSILSQFGVGTWLLRELSRLFAGADEVPEEYDLRL